MRARVVFFWLVVAALLLPALLLTFTRIVEPGGGFWIQVEAFTPLGIAAYGVALLVLAGRILVVRRWSSPAVPLAAVAAAGLVLHAWWYSPQLTGPNPPPAAGAPHLVVMTANLREGEADGIDLVEQASDADVDLLVVEEVTAAELADMDRAGLADLLPHRVGAPNDAADGTMAFARTELTSPTAIATSHDGWSFAMGDLTVLAVHPYAPTDPDAWHADQSVIAQAVAAADPDLVVGDFNATADHAPMRDLAGAGYRDVGELANRGWQPTWPTSGVFDLLGLPVAQIDHVLVGPDLAAIGMRTEEIEGSDHRAVVAEVARK